MKETAFTGYLAADLRKAGVSFVWKIHTQFSGGTPDLFLEGPNRDLWLEAKYVKSLPKRGTTLIDLTNENQYLSRLQQDWLKRRYTVRGDVAVIVGSEVGCALFTGMDWQIPITTAAFRDLAVPRKTVIKHLISLLR